MKRSAHLHPRLLLRYRPLQVQDRMGAGPGQSLHVHVLFFRDAARARVCVGND